MTNQKTGKNRLDKYYHLAKENGYRARSAYKLIQLNKKYNFLYNTNTAIDLCAAPGGWLQVLKQELSYTKIANKTEFRKRNLIIGIDLNLIQQIPDIITIKEDITTESCYNQIRNILEDNKIEKVETILNDGAPNVGTNWDHDAYIQNELTLHACKLSYLFLKKGGTFVTKIFRSIHYFDLLFVFNKLFDEVKVTKPLASRNESAEIFVVCMKFKGIEISMDFFKPEIIFNNSDKIIKKDIILLSNILKLDKTQFNGIFKEYRNIEIDIETDIFDKNDILDFKDLQQISNSDCKKLIKKFRKLQKLILPLKSSKLINNINEEEYTETQKKINKIKREMKKQIREEKKIEEYKLLRIAKLKSLENSNELKIKNKSSLFFNDSLFKEINNKELNNEISSDEESFSLQSDEKQMVLNLKKNPDKFIDGTVNKFSHNEHENLPDFYLKEEEEFYKRNLMDEDIDSEDHIFLKKKQNEYKNRKALRAEKYQKKMIEENKTEGDNLKNKIFNKSNNKKRKQKEVIRSRKGRTVSMRKNIKLVDKRMKKDLRRRKIMR